MRLLILMFTLGFVCSCHQRTRQVPTTVPPNTPATAPHILFLQIKVTQNEAVYDAKIINQKEVVGILDKNLNGPQLFENQWLISTLDDKENVLEQTTVPNPLDEYFEVADDKGQFKSVNVKKKEAEFFFRVSANPKITHLQVEQILSEQKKKKLFLIKL